MHPTPYPPGLALGPRLQGYLAHKKTPTPLRRRVLGEGGGPRLQGYLAQKKTPTPLGTPQDLPPRSVRVYRGTSPIRTPPRPAPYRRPMPRFIGGS